MAARVAVVTGANKGLGLEIVAGLCKRFKGIVYLTSRDEERGKKAQETLVKRGISPQFHQLDITDPASVERFAAYKKKQYGGIDILINNAGVFNAVDWYNTYEESKTIIDINYRALFNVEKDLYPLLRQNARVLHISSDCGHLSNVTNKYWLEKLSNKNLTVEVINDFVNWHLKEVKNGTFNKEDFADNGTVAAYRASKVAVSALTIIQAQKYKDRNIAINSMHPGLVKTDMTKNSGFLSAEEAAKVPLDLVLDAPQEQTGTYVWFDGKAKDWYDISLELYFKSKTLAQYQN